jgi:hypothetical protein
VMCVESMALMNSCDQLRRFILSENRQSDYKSVIYGFG